MSLRVLRNWRPMFAAALVGSVSFVLAAPVIAEETPAGRGFGQVVFGCATESIEAFEAFAVRAKEAGATHIQIQAEDLPPSYHLMTPPGDPYPAWAITNPDLLKVSIPESLKPYLDAGYAEAAMSILEKRCEVLRKHGLKAAFHTYAPQMLPEAVYADHPLWKGPRVDNPRRARVVRFAPAIDNPEVQALYSECVRKFITRCPEVEILILRTNDSGAGVDWSSGLYSGPNGNAKYQYRPMADRLRDFMKTLQAGAAEAGGTLAVNIYNMKEADLPGLARQLDKNMAVDFYEFPDAKPFSAGAGSLFYFERAFSPAAGIPWPGAFLEELERAAGTGAPRLLVYFGDHHNKDLYFEVYKRFWENPSTDTVSRLRVLERVAENVAGPEQSRELVEMWLALQRAERSLRLLDLGGTMLLLGGVHERWLTRPFVPFPQELTPDERDYYREFQFQAGTEEDANDMSNVQGDHYYSGWSGYWFVYRILIDVRGHWGAANTHLWNIIQKLPPDRQGPYMLLNVRMQALYCLLNNAENAVSYQAQMDRVKEADIKPDPFQDYVTARSQSTWDRQLILKTARQEIDNTAELISLIQSRPNDVIIDTVHSKDEEYVRMLGPDLVEQLKKKINIMNAHWEDYRRIYTQPNG